MAVDVLVIDDEKDIRQLVAEILEDEGFSARLASDGNSAIQEIRKKKPDLVILDVWLNDSRFDGIQLLDIIKEQQDFIPAIMISGHGTIETAVKSLQRGAYDFLEKPFTAERLLTAVSRALEFSNLKRENEKLKSQTATSNQLVGVSQAILQIKQNLEKIAPTNSRVFIVGPVGAGKETMAQMIHNKSSYAGGPFISYNCSEKNPERLEKELFGEESKNAMQDSGRVGVLEKASNGTLYFDNILDLPAELQGKLVRVLHDNAFTRVGGQNKIPLNMRIIASSPINPGANIKNRLFREDLYYRLAVVTLSLPSLSQRQEDISILVEELLNVICKANNVDKKTCTDEALATLQAYDWPGNIRQLRNVLEWAVIMHPRAAGSKIEKDHLPPEVRGETVAIDTKRNSSQNENTSLDEELLQSNIFKLPLRQARELFEKHYLKAQVERFGGNISRTSAFIGMERSALHRKLKTLNIYKQSNTG